LKRLRSQTSRGIGERLMTTTKTEAWTLLDKESQLYIAEDNKVADGSVDSIVEENKDGDGSMDLVRRREQIICTYT
jgi:hypothetical protein